MVIGAVQMFEIGFPKPEDVAVLSDLFNQYRVFYDQPSDLAGAEQFIRSRLQAKDSTLLVARDSEGICSGFVQLYRIQDSLSLKPAYILYDLFVTPTHRRQGAARALLEAAEQTAREEGCAYIVLDTAANNEPAKTLYRGYGYAPDSNFISYYLELEE
jgi:ribosomal protein S18 acetylase RimI-like enzyme